MAEQSEITADHKFRFEARLHSLRRVSAARETEQKRIADQIEVLLYAAKSEETCNALLALAFTLFEGDKR